MIWSALTCIPCDEDIFVAVITSATEVGNTRPSANTPESVSRIHEVCFYSLTSSTWDDVANPEPAWNYSDTDIVSLRDNYTQNPGAGILEHPCLPLTKILSSGSFYFALEPQWDLSTRFSERLPSPGSMEKGRAHDITNFDERFIWNEYIVRSLLDFRDRLDPQEREDLDRCQFIVILFPHLPQRCVHISFHRSWRFKDMSEFSQWHSRRLPPTGHPSLPPFR